ncbi:MAG: DnaT-like ssDNA-binding domain-containing protein [Pseudomonadales bacterium]
MANPDAEFRRFCWSRPKQLPSLITSDWQPSRETLQRLVQNNINPAFALCLVPEFILYWKDVGRVESDWQSIFCERVLTYSKGSNINSVETTQNDNLLQKHIETRHTTP